MTTTTCTGCDRAISGHETPDPDMCPRCYKAAVDELDVDKPTVSKKPTNSKKSK